MTSLYLEVLPGFWWLIRDVFQSRNAMRKIWLTPSNHIYVIPKIILDCFRNVWDKKKVFWIKYPELYLEKDFIVQLTKKKVSMHLMIDQK